MCEVTGDAEAAFEKSLQSPALVRDFVEKNACAEHGSRGTVALQLLASELVTNAVLYGEPPVEVGISCDGYSMRVEVHDHGAAHPSEEGWAPDSLGFLLVNKVAHEWGVTPVPEGRTFWGSIRTGMVPGQTPRPWPEAEAHHVVEERLEPEEDALAVESLLDDAEHMAVVDRVAAEEAGSRAGAPSH
ncbi:MAG TPA: ATP-binding protein [Nocardioidaceae bacterium]